MITKGSKWKCVDDDFMEFGETCEVVDYDNTPGSNGDNDVEVRFPDGSTMYMKARRFMSRYKRIA